MLPMVVARAAADLSIPGAHRYAWGLFDMYLEDDHMITLTDNATVKVKELIAQEGQDGLMLRVQVRPGGCAGYSYEMFFDSDTEADDMVADQGGVNVVVDPSSAQLLTGATLDYKDGLQGAGFSIDNPNAQKSCGCGNSFS